MSIKHAVALNGFYLFLLQIANYAAPLVTIPYLVRALGMQNYGAVAFASAFIQYFVNATSYGFDFTITRKISLETNDTVIGRIFSTTLFIKLCISLLGLTVMSILVLAVPFFRVHWELYYITYLVVLGNVAFPTWFFQGIQRMMSITVANVVARVLSVVLIFSLIRQPTDYLEAALIQSSALFVAGLIALGIAIFKFHIRLSRPTKSEALSQLREGAYVFVSSLSGTVYSQGAVLVTGLISGEAAAGYYSLAQKVGATLVGLAHPVIQAVYPYLCRLFEDSPYSYSRVKRTMLLYGTGIALLIGAGTFLFSGYAAHVLAGANHGHLTSLLRIYSAIIVFTMCNVILNPFVLSMEKYKTMQRMYTGVAVLFLVISIPMTFFYADMGMAWSIVVVELSVTVGSILMTRQPNVGLSSP